MRGALAAKSEPVLWLPVLTRGAEPRAEGTTGSLRSRDLRLLAALLAVFLGSSRHRH